MHEEEDIITEPLPPSKGKTKDPRRVRAGLALAEKNRLARAALKREEEREKREEIIQSISQEGSETKTELPWQYFIAIGGVIIAGTSLYLQWKRRPNITNVSIPSQKVEETVQKQHTPPMI